MSMSQAQQDQTIRICTTVGASLSICGAIFILARYYRVRFSGKNQGATNATTELVHVLAWLDLCLAIGHCAGVLPARTFDEKKGEPVTGICKLQGFDILSADLALIAWNLCMAYNLFRWVCYAEEQAQLLARIRKFLLITVGFAGGISLIVLLDNAFGDAGMWCMISAPYNRTKEAVFKYGGLYLWVILGTVGMIVLLARVRQNVHARVEGDMSADARTAYLRVVHNQSILIIGFVACWLPALVHRTLGIAMNQTSVYPFNILHVLSRTMQGFVNAVIFGHFHRWVADKLHADPYVDAECGVTGATSDFSTLVDLEAREQKKFCAARASIFTTTIDLNWGTFPTNIESWFPVGSDIYVVTLLRCAGVRNSEECVGKHLITLNSPASYRSVTSLAGSERRGDIHDAHICQLVFVNDTDVANGNLQYSTTDTELWTRGKPLYQAVGITLRYFDTSLALVSCNSLGTNPAPPDMIGAHVPQNGSAVRQARALGLNLDRCHHTFFGGLLEDGMDCISHSHAKVQRALQQQRAWVDDSIAPQDQLSAVCNLYNLDVDRLTSIV